MQQASRELPETMVSPETGELLRRGVRHFLVTYKTQV
jgi:HTH-type transcriptional regulator/antitoxin MqsA